MGIGPAVAIPAAVAQAGLTMEDIDVFEINEAFASQVGGRSGGCVGGWLRGGWVAAWWVGGWVGGQLRGGCVVGGWVGSCVVAACGWMGCASAGWCSWLGCSMLSTVLGTKVLA